MILAVPVDVNRKRRFRISSSGFSLAELLALMAVIAVIAAVATPAMLSYWQGARLKAGAQQLVSVLNRARSIAIANNGTVCVNRSANRVQFLTGGCAGTVWTGPGTDGNGWFTLANDVNVSAATANVVFNYMGAATTGGTYTVQNPLNNSTLSVTVALSGRVTIGP